MRTKYRSTRFKVSPLSLALTAACVMSWSSLAAAQEPTEDPADNTTAPTLDRMVVTGSLIPQTEIEGVSPVTIITANDIQARGYANLADVLKSSAFATGSVQGAQASASFTQGAETISLFGLPPGYVKYLIDGRPMANYPALYDGTDTFNNISGIPVELIERIEVLPGGQSSLYGSDAIAGVINVILKKNMDGAAVTLRGGTYTEGGGNSFRGSLSGGFSAADGRLNGLLGAQHEVNSAIWAHQRDMTRSFFTEGTTPAAASPDYAVVGYLDIANANLDRYGYALTDPTACTGLAGQFDGTVQYQQAPAGTVGGYCGSFRTPGYRTLMNGKEASHVYGNLTFDINDSTQVYANLLVSDESVKHHAGPYNTWWGSQLQWEFFYDPQVDGLVKLQRHFSPEDIGAQGYQSSMGRDNSDSTRISVGINGLLGQSSWDYDLGYTRASYKLTEIGLVQWKDAVNEYFRERVLGPQQGLDPYFGQYPVFTPNYTAFYAPLPAGAFDAFSGYAVSRSETVDETIRAQLTSTDLFSLPGGPAGMAVLAEVGRQRWDYTPDPGYTNGQIWGRTAVAGKGERDRYAAVAELRLPLLDSLTATVSGRYDAFKASGRTIDKPTYSMGLEWRPLDNLLVRGKFGTAFRAPSLSDLYQGESGSYNFVADYYNCSLLGIDPSRARSDCPGGYANRQVFSTTSGSLDLEPINADVWSAGVVWAPISGLSVSLDYHRWDIEDEVIRQNPDNVMLNEYRCRTGLENAASTLCRTTLAQVERNSSGMVTRLHTPKVNVSRRTLDAATLGLGYATDFENFGKLVFRANYTQTLDHRYQRYAEDPMLDLQRNPGWNTDPQRKADASLTWSRDMWSSTLFASWFGSTPNNRAMVDNGYASPMAGKVGSFLTYNASVSFRPVDNLQFSLQANNLFNTMPPKDHSMSGDAIAPYDSWNFNPYGRALFLEMRYGFGGN